MAVPRAEKRPLLVRLIPTLNQPARGSRAPAAVMFVRDPDAATPGSVLEVASLYGLSPREALVFEKLTEDKSVKEAAEEIGIAEVTARNHVARALAKTGTNKQSELIRLLLSSRLELKK